MHILGSVILKFGFCLPIFAGWGDTHPRTPLVKRVDADDLRNSVLAAENLGFETLWVVDHLIMGRDNAILEGWTTMCWAAGLTSRIRIGSIHLSNMLRSPALTAKMSASLDVISNGRVDFFFEMGHEGIRPESEAYGYKFLDDTERFESFEEALQIIKLMWTKDEPGFEGKHHSIDRAVSHPFPVQRPHPPIWIGTLGGEMSASSIAPTERVMELIARYADGWNNTPASLDHCRTMLEMLQKACEQNDREYGSIRKSIETQILIAPTRGEVERLKDQISEANPTLYDDRAWKLADEQYLIGDPETIAERIAEYESIGIDHMQLWFMDMPSLRGMHAFAEKVAPAFQLS